MKNIVILLTVAIFMSSCVSEKKVIVAKNKLYAYNTQIQKENAEVEDLKKETYKKYKANKIDDTILNRIERKLPKVTGKLDTAQILANQLKQILNDEKKTKWKYRSIVLPVLDSLKKINDQYAQRLALYLMIKDGLNVADYKQFDLAAFFGPGKYHIPEDKVEKANLSFEPLMDSIMLFSNKYSQYPRTATLVILGFADGTGITPESELYYTLLKELNKPQATKEELNKQLSELRAKELALQMTGIYLKKAPGFKNVDNLHIEYIGQGKGEAFPISKIKDYTIDDERRRIVLCYWVVLPD